MRGIFLRTDALRTEKSIIYDNVPVGNYNYNTNNYASYIRPLHVWAVLYWGLYPMVLVLHRCQRVQVVGTKPLSAVTGGRTGVMPSCSRAHSVGPVWRDTRLASLEGF